MSSSGPGLVTIPARITVQDLAGALGEDTEAVSRELARLGQPGGAEDFVSAEMAVQAADSLGIKIAVEARDLALEHLYTLETAGSAGVIPPDRAGRLVSGVGGSIEDLDTKIEAASEHWSVARMPVIDRNILRIGLYELENEPETPTAVIVAEAVRLAQTYSTERSGSFVNGVLAALAEEVRG